MRYSTATGHAPTDARVGMVRPGEIRVFEFAARSASEDLSQDNVSRLIPMRTKAPKARAKVGAKRELFPQRLPRRQALLKWRNGPKQLQWVAGNLS